MTKQEQLERVREMQAKLTANAPANITKSLKLLLDLEAKRLEKEISSVSA